jgi:membrane protease YdiL (CAAX protease family)
VTALYFALAFLITWSLQLPAVLAAKGWIAGPTERYMMLVGLGAFGPAAAAMIAARVEGTAVSTLLRPLRTWRVGAQWYLVALLVPGATFVVAACIYDTFGHAERLFYLPNRPAFVAAAVAFPLGEEIGWRGFALPRLTRRFGPLPASILLGVLWTLWHVPMLTLQGVSAELYLAFVPFLVGGSVLFTWVYGHTRGSLLLAVLMHVGAHLNNPGHAMPQRATPMLLHAAAYVALAAVLVLGDREAWRAPAALQ